MAANTNGSGSLSVGTGELTADDGVTGWSLKVWAKYNALTAATIILGVDNGGEYWQIGTDGTALLVGWNTGFGEATLLSSLTTSEWFCITAAFRTTSTSTGVRVYVSTRNRRPNGVNSGNNSVGPSAVYLGTDGFAEQANACFAGWTIWDGALTDAELIREHAQVAPVRGRDLWHYESLRCPVFAIGRDTSGRGRDFTRAGTWTLANYAPPAPEVASPRAMPFGLALG